MSGVRRLLLTVDSIGGVWQYSIELTRVLARLGYETTLVLLGPAPSDSQREAVKAIPRVRLVETHLPLDWLAPDTATVARAGAEIARLAETLGVDIVQLNQPALAAGVRFAMPVVAVAHSCVGTWWQAVRGDEPEPAAFAWQTALMQGGLVAADMVIAPSHAFGAALQLRYALTASPHVVHNGRASLVTTSGEQHDFAFTAGRLWDEAKNIGTLDRAAALLGIPIMAAGPVTGPNGQRALLEHVHGLGSIEEGEIAAYLSARPVFVSAAQYEPFGLAVLEAALTGCPLVLSDIPTFRELWSGAAIFVEPNDSAGFAAAIEGLIDHMPARLARGDLARRRAARFTPARMASEMDALFTRLLHQTRGRKVAA